MISKSFFSFKRNEEPNQRKNAILITLDPKHKHQFEFWRQKWSWCIFHLRVLENASEASFLVKSDPKRETGRPNVESNSSRVRRSNITMGAKKSLFCYRLRRALYILKELKCCSFGKLNVFSNFNLTSFSIKKLKCWDRANRRKLKLTF